MTKTEPVFETCDFNLFKICCKTVEKVHKNDTFRKLVVYDYIAYLIDTSICLPLEWWVHEAENKRVENSGIESVP
jgi:hypothetical protein